MTQNVIGFAFAPRCTSLLIFLTLCCALPARADVNGFGDFAPINSSGHAPRVGLSAGNAVLTLTDGDAGEASSAFSQSQQAVAGFTASFTYQADKFGGPPPGGADGIAFVIQNDPRGLTALGGQGGGLGYGTGDGGTAIARSAAIRLTLYSQSGISIGTAHAGEQPEGTLPVDFRSGHLIRVTLDYDGALVTESLKDLTTGATFTDQDELDLPAALESGMAFVGFTGASGAATAHQTVQDFSFVSHPATAHSIPPVPKVPVMHTTLVSYVDPFIGTDGSGDTLPGANAPFGMTTFSPDTSAPSVGYAYADHRIEGFSLNHMSGVGCPDEGDVFLTATTGPVTTQVMDYASPFSHKHEAASAGYYSVDLRRWNVHAELTAMERTGLIRFTFPAGQPGNILIPISHTLTHTMRAGVHLVGHDTVEGSVRSNSFCNASAEYTVYFTLKLDKPCTSAGTWTGATQSDNSKDAAQTGRDAPAIGAYLRFPESSSPFTVTARIGISYVDIAGARRNLAQEVGSRDFDQVRQATEKAWDTELHKIEITGGTTDQRTIFYTSLYHCLLMPSLSSDTDGRYLGFDDAVHHAPSGHAVYADFSGWDIYRTEAPLLTLIEPKRMQDMCQSIMLMYTQGGWIDRWPQANTYTGVMCGSPLTIVAATAWNAGLHGFDMAALYPGMLKDATQSPPPGKPYYGEGNIGYMDTLGYIPDDKEGYGSVSQTEEDCIAYAALASVAASLGKTDDAAMLTKRALDYRNLFDPQTKFLRPRLADGTWYAPFDPAQEHGYIEGSAWHYRWLAPQDVSGLIHLLGGDDAFNAELDKFFRYSTLWNDQYYNPYNEPDLQAPFLYDYSGAPWKTQARVRELLADAYKITPAGIPGNDDCGTMSAWYVFAALGLYPVDSAHSSYVLCSPLFPRAVVHLDAPYPVRQFVVDAPTASASNLYQQSLRVGQTEWLKPWLNRADIIKSGTLKFTLGPVPDKSWGTAENVRPPSLSH